MPPTSRYGAVGTYNQTVGVKLDIDEAIEILSPYDIPLTMSLPTTTTTQTKVSWLNEELTPQSAVVDSFTGTGPWTVTVGTDDVAWFRPGDILWDQNKAVTVQFTVTSIDTGAGTMVIAGHASNTTGPSNSDTLTIIGQYRDEGSDPPEMRSTDRGEAYNITQIFQEGVEATRTARKNQLYGQGDPYDHEVEKKFKELNIRREKAFLYGQRVESGDKKKRAMGGFFYYLTTLSGSNTKANVYSMTSTVLRSVWDAGYTGGLTLWVSPAVKVAISQNVDAALRQSSVDTTRGGYVIESLKTDFGEVNLAVNRWLPPTKGLLLGDGLNERVVHTPLFHELLAKTGDRDEGELVEESSLKVKHPEVQAVITVTDA